MITALETHGSAPVRSGGVVSSPLRAVPYAMAAAFAFLGLRPLNDPDVWWHLRLGEFIAERHSVPGHDPFSTLTSQHWVTHEWLSELVMYGAYDLGGYKGVAVLRATLMLGIGVTIAHATLSRANAIVASMVTLLALVAVWPGTGERPQLASFLMFALLGPWLLRRLEAGRGVWLLVPVVALWSNLHGFWSLAVALYAACVVGLLLDSQRGDRRAVLRRYAPPLIAAVLAAVINPNGVATLTAPFAVTGYARFVSEWRPPTLLSPFHLAAFVLLGLVIAGWARRERPTSWLRVAFVGCSAAVGFLYSRDVPIAAVLLAPLAAEAAMELLGWRRDVAAGTRLLRISAGAALAGLCVIAASLWLPAMPGIAKGAPVDVSERLDALPAPATVITEYDLGAWLFWSTRNTQPAIDGRTELYSVPYVERYFDTLAMKPGWRGFVEHGDFEAAWLRKGTPLVTGLRDILGWRVVPAKDGETLVLFPPTH